MDSKMTTPLMSRTYFAILAGWALVFIAAVLAYWPGLGGPFVFDDLGVVPQLGDLGGVRNWETFRAFVFGGTAGPTGRPLAMLSFLIDARDWPAESWAFKRTNLAIHLVNGALLGILTRQILMVAGRHRKKAALVALISMGAWLLHPFLVSTTLYVVQRMAQLSTTFMFAGLAGYMYFRTRLAGDNVAAYIPVSLWLTGCTLLSILAKENGALLPLLAGILELTVLSGRVTQVPKLNRIWLTVFIGAPVVLLVSYLAYMVAGTGFFVVVPPRNFSIYERLLTESRVLVDYLQNWFIPKLYTTGVFQDHYIKSTGLFAPLSTLLSVIFHTVLLTLAVAKRREWSLFALAVLFFYGGHLLESTVLNLELYFEHRNYLPAAFLFLPLFAALSNKADTKVLIGVSVGILCLLGSFTRYSSTVWSDYDSMVQASVQKAPTSARAQARFAAILFNAGHVDESLEVLDRALVTVDTGQPQLLVSKLIYLCHLGRLDTEGFGRVGTILAESSYDPRMINIYRELVSAIVDGHCPSVPINKLKQVFESMLLVPPNDQPSFLGYSQLKYFVGYVSAYGGEPEVALEAFLESLNSRPGATSAMAMAALLAANRHFEESLPLSNLALEQMGNRGAATLRGAKVSESDIRAFQEAVRVDRAMKQDHDSTNRVD